MINSICLTNVSIDMGGGTISGDINTTYYSELQVTDADWSFNRDSDPAAYALELVEYLRLRFIYGNITLDEYMLPSYAEVKTWAFNKLCEAYPTRGVNKIVSLKFYPKGGYSIIGQFIMDI